MLLEYIIPLNPYWIISPISYLNAMQRHHAPQLYGYAIKTGESVQRQNGVLVAMEAGETTGYALYNLQDRAVMFMGPGVAVYEGMIVGENSRDNDLVVNPCKQKQMSNMRSKAADEAITLTPPHILTLEQSIEYISEEELVEVTPKSIRLRKKYSNKSQRKKSGKEEIDHRLAKLG